MPDVDVLSRFPVDAMCVSTDNIIPKIKFAQGNDSKVKAIRELAVSNYEGYCNKNGILYKFLNGRKLLFVPVCSQKL